MPPSFHPVNGSPLSKALTYISISLGKSTSWIANVRATRSTRPPPKACSRQVSTDETRKQVRTTMKRMAMMNTKVLVTIDSSSSIAPKTDKLSIISDNGNYVRLRWWKLLSKTRFIMRNHVLGFQLFYRNPELDPLHRLITIFLHCYHCQDPHSGARTAVYCSQEEPQRNAGATNIIYKVL